VDANRDQLEVLCDVIGIDHSKYDSADKISEYMIKNKTKWALKVFSSDVKLNYPDYVIRLINWCYE